MLQRAAPISYKSIGHFRTPHKRLEGTPLQPLGALGCQGIVTVYPEYTAGLVGLEGFSHIIALYHMHESCGHENVTLDFLDDIRRGVYATRASRRPNAIGVSVLQLIARSNRTLLLENVDVLDWTPVLDIKPYIPAFDAPTAFDIGWFASRARDVLSARSDGRFSDRSACEDNPPHIETTQGDAP